MLLFPAFPRDQKTAPVVRVVQIAFLCLFSSLLRAPDLRAANAEAWPTLPPEQLTGKTAPLEPDAAAEVLLRKIEIDDTDFPNRRTTTEYTRYKIFDPERADPIVRLSQFASTYSGDDIRDVDMSARLTLADGSTKEFGAESVHEQVVVRKSASESFLFRLFGSSGIEVKHKFIAVGGTQPGSILEFKVRTVEMHPPRATFRPLQIADIPTRRLEYTQHLGRTPYFRTSFFVLNNANIETQEDQENLTVTLSGHDLPSLHDEPYSGVPADYSATAVSCYDITSLISYNGFNISQRTAANQDPWAAYATVINWFSKDHIQVNRAVKEAAQQITQGAKDDLEKAQRIHDYVQNLFQRFVHQPKKSSEAASPVSYAVKMKSVLNFEKDKPPHLSANDFLWLAISLDRAAGLHAEVLLVPSRSLSRFDPRLVSMAFLPDLCAAVEVGGQWHFSMPQLPSPLLFDQLPWQLEGQPALLALEDKQEFIDVPCTAPAQTVIRHEGTFELSADGTLTGQGKLSFTGHSAYSARSVLRGKNEERQRAIVQKFIDRELAPAEIEITGLKNLDDLSQPVEISFHLTWTGFATVADHRLFIHPFVFRTHATSPFAATERHYPIYFPYARQENDHLTIAFPAGYDLEAKVAPASHPGESLSHTLKLAYSPKHHVLYVDRDFSSTLIAVPPSDYAQLKQWY
ncbi:MAG: hypothetical protein ABSE59_01300, partial [Opitutaceae bacterium]